MSKWCLDSGATDHLVNSDLYFSEYVNLKTPVKISVAKESQAMNSTKIGNISVITDQGIKVNITNVLYCSELRQNLLSIRKLVASGHRANFSEDRVDILDNKLIIKEQ